MKTADFISLNADKGKYLFNSAVKISNNENDKKTEKNKGKSLTADFYTSIDDMVKALQERIEAVKQNEKYDDKTKKYKIESLQKQIDELNELKSLKEVAEIQKKLDEVKKKADERDKKEEAYTDINEDGDTYLSEEDAKALTKAQVSLESISYYSQIQALHASEANMLKTEAGIDGYASAFKSGLYNKLTGGVAKLEMAKSAAMGSINRNMAEIAKNNINTAESTEATDKNDDIDDTTNVTEAETDNNNANTEEKAEQAE